MLDLDSALQGASLTIDDERVLWNGFELLSAQAVLLERPVFAWPQPGVGAAGLAPQAAREGRSLIVSALHTVARSVRMLDPPESADVAVAPLIALDRCADLGLAVQPWELVAQRPNEDGRAWFDPAGGDHWLASAAPAVGEPAWSPQPFTGEVLSVLTIGAEVVGARRFSDAAAWNAGKPEERIAPGELTASDRDTALAAQRALGLSWLQTDLVQLPHTAILRLHPGVDLGPWEHDMEGGPSTALVKLLLDQNP